MELKSKQKSIQPLSLNSNKQNVYHTTKNRRAKFIIEQLYT